MKPELMEFYSIKSHLIPYIRIYKPIDYNKN